jgi:hypothetical protein
MIPISPEVQLTKAEKYQDTVKKTLWWVLASRRRKDEEKNF